MNDATAIISANGSLLAIIAAVFFFLPGLALALLAPGFATIAPDADPAAVLEMFTATFLFGFLLYIIVTYIGTIALLSLMGDARRLTVAEAIQAGVTGFIPYFLAQLLLGIGVAIIFGLTFGIAGAISTVLVALLAIIAIPAFIYLYTKFSLTAPVVAIDGVRNPITALTRSWKLMSGNTLRVFLFYLILIVAILVVYFVISIILGLFIALLGPGIGLVASAIVQGVLTMAFTILFLAILAAVHRQLAGPSTTDVSETFE